MKITLPQILSLARAGNPARAWSLFVEAGLHENVDDPKTLSLKGRLLKDRAKAATGPEKIRLYGKAASAYSAAVQLTNDSYPLINAAALALLGDEPERSSELAKDTLRLLDTDPRQGENAYWRAATRSEALLLLGDEAGARAALTEGMLALPRAWEDHAATIGQFELILDKQNKNIAWLDEYRPPSSFYFSGIISLNEEDQTLRQNVDAIIAREKPGFGFGALAAGADILIAEALSASGVDLHITLPYPVDRFCELSVAPYGAHWVTRFETLLEVVAELEVLTEPPDEAERSISVAVELANLVTMGRCIRNADMLKSHPKAITIIDKADQLRRQHMVWSRSGHKQFQIPVSRQTQTLRPIPSSPSQNSTITGVLWVDDITLKPSLAGYVAQESMKGAVIHDTPTGFYIISTGLTDMLALARSLLKQNENGRISLVIDMMDFARPAPSLLSQAGEMAGASTGGTMVADYKSAMIISVLAKCVQIEEIGELNTAYGPIALWSIK